jgi:hypothetical protein
MPTTTAPSHPKALLVAALALGLIAALAILWVIFEGFAFKLG